jgi:ATP-dependent Clp protease ATP-binding subunit ClpA
VFERFTERARQVVVLAQDEARELRHNYIGTEHLLLGLLREEEGVAARVLESLDITIEEARAQVARVVGEGGEAWSGQIPFTPRAKNVLELSLREALSLGHNYIGTEHVLLGLVREADGVGARILLDFDADAEKIRDEVIRALSAPPPSLTAELERVRKEKEAAIAAHDFETAAVLRERERELQADVFPSGASVASKSGVGLPRRTATHGPVAVTTGPLPLVVAIVLAAVGFPLGLAAGWLIWG